jgi:hypothetical protein
MLAKSAAKGGAGQCIRATLPYIRSDVPIIIIFRALGFVVRPQDHDQLLAPVLVKVDALQSGSLHGGGEVIALCDELAVESDRQRRLPPPLHGIRVSPFVVRFQADKDILEHIVHDFRDTAMMEALRPSIEEALPINSQDLALDFIGKRGSSVGVTRAKRLEYARDILQKEMLPHVGIAPGCETKKVCPASDTSRRCAVATQFDV